MEGLLKALGLRAEEMKQAWQCTSAAGAFAAAAAKPSPGGLGGVSGLALGLWLSPGGLACPWELPRLGKFSSSSDGTSCTSSHRWCCYSKQAHIECSV